MFTVEDLKVFCDVIKHFNFVDHEDTSRLLNKACYTTEYLISNRQPELFEKHVCIDDCPEYTDANFNSSLLNLPLNTLINKRSEAGYLGKAIIDWRVTIKK